jgi:ABC-2 type transport system ATP-binding protein
MPTVEISRVTKSYGKKTAVADLSFSLDPGEIFGLIGPNGAGKTSTIRMMMDIIRPDAGAILILGERMCAQSKGRIGFLPEERGLYRKLRVIDTLLYLASLKGMDRRKAEQRADELLERVGMAAHKTRKIESRSSTIRSSSSWTSRSPDWIR